MAVRVFYRFLFWLVPIWYGLTLNATRLRRWPPLPRFYQAKEIAEELEWGSHWRPDPLRGVLDVVMDPRKMQNRIDAGESEFGDCDDHALYWATALLQSGLADRAWLGTAWYGEGHVVCVFDKDGERFWTDYGIPKRVRTAWDWAVAVGRERGKTSTCAGMLQVKLRPNGAPRLCFVRGLASTTKL